MATLLSRTRSGRIFSQQPDKGNRKPNRRPNRKKNPFNRLPGEIRMQIWNEVIENVPPVHIFRKFEGPTASMTFSYNGIRVRPFQYRIAAQPMNDPLIADGYFEFPLKDDDYMDPRMLRLSHWYKHAWREPWGVMNNDPNAIRPHPDYGYTDLLLISQAVNSEAGSILYDRQFYLSCYESARHFLVAPPGTPSFNFFHRLTYVAINTFDRDHSNRNQQRREAVIVWDHLARAVNLRELRITCPFHGRQDWCAHSMDQVDFVGQPRCYDLCVREVWRQLKGFLHKFGEAKGSKYAGLTILWCTSLYPFTMLDFWVDRDNRPRHRANWPDAGRTGPGKTPRERANLTAHAEYRRRLVWWKNVLGQAISASPQGRIWQGNLNNLPRYGSQYRVRRLTGFRAHVTRWKGDLPERKPNEPDNIWDPAWE